MVSAGEWMDVGRVDVQALILSGFGINCEAETQTAFERAGAQATRIHLNDLIQSPQLLHEHHILAIPGGFSFGDDVAAGKIFANRLRFRLGEQIKDFVAGGKLVIGICNGFQVMVKMGLLPLFEGEFVQEVTLTHNDSGRFENRWVQTRVDPATRCVWLKGIETLEMPVRHGEGKFVARDEATLDRLRVKGQVALRYARSDGAPAGGTFPANPNGSTDDVAGICDPTGRVLGLMPHHEAYLEATNHPRWTRDARQNEGAGLRVFRNAVEYVQENLLAETTLR